MKTGARTEEAGQYLLEDELSPKKAASLTYIATELGEGHEMYEDIQRKVEAYLGSTDDILKGSSTGEKIEVGELRDILDSRRENFYEACESAFGELTESNRELIEETQKAYFHSITGDLTHNGEEVKVFQN